MPIFSRRKKSKKKSCSFCRVPFDKPAIKNFSNCPFGKKQKKREKTAGPRRGGDRRAVASFRGKNSLKETEVGFLAALSRLLTHSWILLGKKKSSRKMRRSQLEDRIFSSIFPLFFTLIDPNLEK